MGALAAMLVLGRTGLKLFGTLIAVVVTTAVVALANLDEVRTVLTIGSIPVGFPALALPRLAGSVRHRPDRRAPWRSPRSSWCRAPGSPSPRPIRTARPSSTNRDFIGQGAGNLLSSVFHGIPVGGSVSTTAINMAAGARSRWSTIFGGVWMLVILVALARVVEMVPLPTLSAVLIFAALMTLKPTVIKVVWKTSTTGKIAMTVTFLSTLTLPIAAAVAVGVICSLVLQLNKEQMDFHLVRLVPVGGHFVERPAPRVLPDAEPVVLDVYGSLLYAGAKTLGARLPDAHGANRPVVILRLRGRGSLGSTFFGVVADYADQLTAAGGRLYLSGCATRRWCAGSNTASSPRCAEKITVFPATEVLGRVHAGGGGGRAGVVGGRLRSRMHPDGRSAEPFADRAAILTLAAPGEYSGQPCAARLRAAVIACARCRPRIAVRAGRHRYLRGGRAAQPASRGGSRPWT